MTIDVLVPPLGQTVDTVILANWYKQEGEPVQQGERLFAIETDKATLDIEAPASGILLGVKAQAGQEVKVLSAIAAIAQPGERLPVNAALSPGEKSGNLGVLGSEAAQNTQISGFHPPSRPVFGEEKGGRGDEKGNLSALDHAAIETPAPLRPRILISPRARQLARQEGVPLEAVTATGPEGAIIERDIRAYLAKPSGPGVTPLARRMAEAAGLDWRDLPGSGTRGRVMRKDIDQVLSEAVPPEATPADNEPLETIPVSGVRAVIAERLSSSHLQTAPVTLTTETDATALVELRRELAKDEIDVSYNDLLLCVLARALREHPRLNASLHGDTITLWRGVHIGLAVDTDRGLLVPVIRNADRKGVGQIAQETQSLAERARAGQCTPDELSGGTFTLTNLGMFGIDAFTPVINLPECAILGVGRIQQRPVMIEDRVVGQYRVWLSLTFDHRLVDGGPAARFLQRVAQLIERPHLLIT